MRVLLIIPPILYERNPSIGVAYIAAYLKDRNHEVKSWDLNTEHLIVNDCDDLFWLNEENKTNFFQEHKNLFEDWVEKILDYKPHIVGFSVWNTNDYCSIKLAEMIKSKDKDILIVFGGPQCTYEGKWIIQNPAVDIVVCSEGEESFSEIIEIFKIKGKVDFCPGCLIKVNGKVIDCGFKPEINDLDGLPYPDFSDLRIERYLFRDYVPISFGRGCLWGCTYCSTNYRWRKFRARAPENIYREIMHRLKEYPTTNKFQVFDPAVNQSLDVLLRLCDLVISNRANIELHGFAQIKPEMDLEMLKKIRKSGFVTLDYGIESGSQKVINSMGRKYNIEDAERVIKDSYNAGIKVAANFIVGFPNETEEDFHETLRFVERIKKYVSNIIPASECGVPYSYIQSHPEKFSVFIPEKNSLDWRTEDGKNTHEERLGRQKIFNDFVKGLGIPGWSSAKDREFAKNLYESKVSKDTILKNVIDTPPFKVFFTWEITYECNYHCTYCHAPKPHNPETRKTRYLEKNKWVQIWGSIYDRYGECEMVISGGEPFSYPGFMDLVTSVSKMHIMEFCTNLFFNVEPIVEKMSPERVRIGTSFHPEFSELEFFIKKINFLKDNGFETWVNFVPWPPFLPQLKEIKGVLEENGIKVVLQPFIGQYEGRHYPHGYADEDKKALGIFNDDANIKTVDFKTTEKSQKKEKLCRMGENYAFIHPDGQAERCCKDKSLDLGNIIEGTFGLLDTPMPCKAAECNCWRCMLVETEPEWVKYWGRPDTK